MAMEGLILLANPGSASRKYALFNGDNKLIDLHFEEEASKVICTIVIEGNIIVKKTDLKHYSHASDNLVPILKEFSVIKAPEEIEKIGIRLVAPSGYFLEDHEFSDELASHLESLRTRAPLHIEATLKEYKVLKKDFPGIKIYGISDSAFHKNKPDYAWNYGLPIGDADKLEIKRFGYHGLSVSSVISTLKNHDKLAHKLLIVHLGSGASVSAIRNGISMDNSMGYSPLEGIVMATRSGTLDITAAEVLRDELHLSRIGLEEYLNNESGLKGLSNKSSDLRVLVEDDSPLSVLAVKTYVYQVVKTIGQMAAAINGIDELVLTGTVGERSFKVRKMILKHLEFLDFFIDDTANNKVLDNDLQLISKLTKSKPIFVAKTNESEEMLRRIKSL